MRISILKKDKIESFVLPLQVHGNYWVKDETSDGKERNFVNIIEDENKWKMMSNYEVSIYDENNTYLESVILEVNKFYVLKVDKEDSVLLYTSLAYDKNTVQLMVQNDTKIIIGSNDSCQICYKNSYVDGEHAILTYKDSLWNISVVSENSSTYVNGVKVTTKPLTNGDVIFIAGLKIIIIRNTIIINNIDKIKVNSSIFSEARFPKQIAKEVVDNDEDISFYKEGDYFFKAPRFRNSIDRSVLQIDPAPQKQPEDKTPVIYTIGPMLTMGITSMVTAFTAVNSAVQGNRSLNEALPSIIIAIAMLATMILWPILIKKYQKNAAKKNEEERVKKYSGYIEKKRQLLKSIMANQTSLLMESYPPLEEVKKIILYKKTNLWEREIEQDDFLKLRIGTGTEPVNIDIMYPEQHFSMEEDEMRGILDNLVNDSKDLENVPITVSFTEKYISAIVGETPSIEKVAYGLILQILAYHSYNDLKLVFFTNKKKEKYWEFAKVLPHCWSDDKTNRYFATTVDEMSQVSSYLENDFQMRTFRDTSGDSKVYDYKVHKPYYLIIVDDFKNARDIEIIKDVLDQKTNVGFSLLILNDKLTNLPNECMDFICIGHNNRSVIFEGELLTNKQKKFIADSYENLDLNECAVKLANIPIDVIKDDMMFPKSISFLEMYNVGKVEQLNSFNRWQMNFASNTLQAPLGVDRQGNLFKLDLHEKFHGPHGLIAGMTGSGKSELIITYILSMAVNYHPDEVSFIIIDYKGGGVAGAFENKELGIKLPHIAGTITNLDTVEMNRSLISIQSELRRRQAAFNLARDKSGESTVDIYKYQKLYRNGIIKEPISHLFIICDEFAELKVQQPEFMDQLISAARIGRSLGVHLILATQKPSGVVDDQIWSNSRFRICLKVQERQDSMDMIKCPDAAMIKNVGRFYLQVGYNEFFAEGLSAWCGAQYIPTDKLKKKIDKSVNFVDNTGYVIKSIDEERKNLNSPNLGEQLPNIVKYLINVADEGNIKVKQLWLDRIPNIIYVDNLKKKYFYKKESGIINPIIGEYDDPYNQRQSLLTLDLTNNGNTIIYGSAGSGESILLTSIIYSCIVNYDTDDVNFYIMDFGSEVLRTFTNAPQVGDILFINDKEKITNLFKKLFSLIEQRKKIFANYNGDFKYYNKKSQKKEPLVVIVLNNYEAFAENYEKEEEIIIQLTREGQKYGIVFITTVSSSNSIRYKLRQNFKQELVLQMNDDSDYMSILGNIGKILPSKTIGRGLLKLDKVYEFQTAFPFEPERLTEYIEIICTKLKAIAKKFVEPIAILPEIVTTEYINFKFKGIDNVPIGVDKNTLAISTWDFKENYSTMITALDFRNINFFIKPLIYQFASIKTNTVLVLDAYQDIEGLNKMSNLFNYKENFDKVIDSLYNNIDKQYSAYAKTNFNKNLLEEVKPVVCIIVGVSSLLLKLNDEMKKKYNSLIEKNNAMQIIKFVFIDTIDVFKKMEYDEWYRSVMKNNNGIWIGNGISNQYTLKLAKITREMQSDIPLGFGYIVKRGIPYLTKFLTSFDGYGDVNE